MVRGQPVDDVCGVARNKRLVTEVEAETAAARAEAEASGEPARRFKDFRWSTRDSWSRHRRIIGKVEWTQGEANPRFIVTSLTAQACHGRWLYETIYCARGERENRIKECQLDLFADRTSAATMRASRGGCGLPRWLTSCCAPCGGSAWRTPSSPTPPAARSGSRC
jgi:hypothetical protein